MTDENSQPDSTGDESLAARLLRVLFERHGVPKHKQSAVVCEVLGLSYSQGYRRLAQQSSWPVDDLAKLAAHFNETLLDLVTLDDQSQEGVFLVGAVPQPCYIKAGAPVHAPRPGSLVAVQMDGRWSVVLAEGTLGTQAFDIERLVIRPPTATSRRIAVLDDHPDGAEAIADYLHSQGFQPVAFTSLDDIATALASEHFDGYVLDWIIESATGADTVRALIASIRSRDAFCPIVVLTGQMRGGAADEADIASAVVKYQLKFHEKPASLLLISAALRASFTTV